MHLSCPSAGFAIGFLCALLASLPAQDDREQSTPTGTYWRPDVTEAALDTLVQQGWRLTDIEIEATSPFEFTVAMVPNSGAYHMAWAYAIGLTASELSTELTRNQARLVDLEAYDAGGITRFVAVMVNNTGANARAWGWLYDTDTTTIGQNVNQYGNRILDLDRYTVGTRSYYSAILTANTGADARAWWWGINLTAAQVQQQATANNAQVIDLERNGSNFDVVMQRVPGAPRWWTLFGATAQQLTDQLSQIGARAIDIEPYVTPFPNLSVRYNAVLINNSNPLSTRISEILRSGTDGASGIYLKQVNGPVLAYINGDRKFEPASSIKVMFHAHAMKQVQVNRQITLDTAIRIPQLQTNGCWTMASNTFTEPLRTSLQLMMENSDNARTIGVQVHFSNDAINAAMQSLQLTNTAVLRLLCQTPFNESTLVDFGKLHEAIANGWLDAAHRQTFYDLMNNSVGYGGVGLAAMIDEEAAALSLPTVARDAFKSEVRIAWKAGSWGPNGSFYWSTFEWLSLPFRNGPVLTPREYVSGVFIDGASVNSQAEATMNLAKREVLREVVRSALATWTNYTGGAFVAFGIGCSGSNGVPQLAPSGVPEAGSAVQFDLGRARVASVASLSLGSSTTSFAGTPLPFDLAPLGAPGCRVLCDRLVSVLLPTSSNGNASFRLDLPAQRNLIGARLHGQFTVIDPPANALGLTTSNAATLTIGGYR